MNSCAQGVGCWISAPKLAIKPKLVTFGPKDYSVGSEFPVQFTQVLLGRKTQGQSETRRNALSFPTQKRFKLFRLVDMLDFLSVGWLVSRRFSLKCVA